MIEYDFTKIYEDTDKRKYLKSLLVPQSKSQIIMTPPIIHLEGSENKQMSITYKRLFPDCTVKWYPTRNGRAWKSPEVHKSQSSVLFPFFLGWEEGGLVTRGEWLPLFHFWDIRKSHMPIFYVYNNDYYFFSCPQGVVFKPLLQLLNRVKEWNPVFIYKLLSKFASDYVWTFRQKSPSPYYSDFFTIKPAFRHLNTKALNIVMIVKNNLGYFKDYFFSRLKEFQALFSRVRIFIYENNSTDGTWEYLLERQKENKDLVLVHEEFSDVEPWLKQNFRNRPVLLGTLRNKILDVWLSHTTNDTNDLFLFLDTDLVFQPNTFSTLLRDFQSHYPTYSALFSNTKMLHKQCYYDTLALDYGICRLEHTLMFHPVHQYNFKKIRPSTFPIMDRLKSSPDEIVWRKDPGSMFSLFPWNIKSQRQYTGNLNRWNLQIHGSEVYGTFQQWKELGCSVKRGAKSIPILYYGEDEEKDRRYRKTFCVFGMGDVNVTPEVMSSVVDKVHSTGIFYYTFNDNSNSLESMQVKSLLPGQY